MYEQNLMVKIKKNIVLQVNLSSYEIQTFTVGRMQMMIFVGKIAHFCHSFFFCHDS